MGQRYAVAGIEPPLEELLDDQIARLIMRRDGIEPAEVWRWIAGARARLMPLAGNAAVAGRVDGIGEPSSALPADSRMGPSTD
jgi:hypothetical protein